MKVQDSSIDVNERIHGLQYTEGGFSSDDMVISIQCVVFGS